MLLSAVILAAVLAQVSASSPRIFSRQDTGLDPNSIPSQCQSSCGTMLTTLDNCSGDISCVCNSDVLNLLSACVSCYSQVYPAELQDEQSYLDQYKQACSESISTADSASTSDSGSVLPVLSETVTADATTVASTGATTGATSTVAPAVSTTSTAASTSTSSPAAEDSVTGTSKSSASRGAIVGQATAALVCVAAGLFVLIL